MCLLDRQHEHRPGICQKYKFSGLSRHLLWIKTSRGGAPQLMSSIHITYLTLALGKHFHFFLSKILRYNLLHHMCSLDYSAKEKEKQKLQKYNHNIMIYSVCV